MNGNSINKTIRLTVIVITLIVGVNARAATETNREHILKAAFLYNFIKFVDWPAEKTSDGNEPIIIGIMSNRPLEGAFEPLKDKQVKNKKVIVKRFKSFEELNKSKEYKKELEAQAEALRKCHVLFICSTEQQISDEVIKLVKGHGVLTVGETGDFLKAGGIINFMDIENKIYFEINATKAKDEKMKISSNLLKLAKKVI